MVEKKIKFENYIYLILILGISIVLMVYFYMWRLAYKDSVLKTPIMNETLQVIYYNELDNYIVENKDAIVYVSVLNDEEIRNFETKFKSYIEKKQLNDKILYLDLTSIMNDEFLKEEAVNKFKLKKKNISDVPCLLFFKDSKLNNIFVIDENKYDFSDLTFYLKQEEVIE